ncbi:MAG: GH3 auxin-responsive promoter family protein [Candidatus Methanofastidiosia archaeon]|jgi:hypothetical protein
MREKILCNLKQIAGDDSALEHSDEIQEKVLLGILKRNYNTRFVKDFSLDAIDSVDKYQKKMPITKYDDYQWYIEQMKSGEHNVLVSGDIPRWAQTSGTLSAPKLYPFPHEMAEQFGETLAKIIVAAIEEEPDRKRMLTGKMLMVVADVITSYAAGKPVGYISGIVSHDVQKIPGMPALFTPPCDILAMEDWENRWLEMAKHASGENVTMSCSTPPILLSYLKKVVNEYSDILDLPDEITEIWPNLELITGAGVKMSLYQNQYQHMLGDQVCCREFYCATEGFFAYQKDTDPGLTPLLDNIFYEFIPLTEWYQMMEEGGCYTTFEFTRLTYSKVACNTDYVMVITTPTGLYSYVIGDIVRFVSPDRLTWVGRIGWESNVAGEKLNEVHMSMLRQSVESTLGVEVVNQMAAVKEDPLQYVFAFEFSSDVNLDEAIDVADKSLRDKNAIYDRLRDLNILKRPEILPLKEGAFERYFQWKQGQTKSLGQVKPPVFARIDLVEELFTVD